MNPEEIALLTKIIGGGSGTAVIFYLALQKLAPLLTNGKKHEAPCADLKVAQSEVQELKRNNERQWKKMDTMSTTLGEIKGATDTIINRLP